MIHDGIIDAVCSKILVCGIAVGSSWDTAMLSVAVGALIGVFLFALMTVLVLGMFTRCGGSGKEDGDGIYVQLIVRRVWEFSDNYVYLPTRIRN